MGSLLKTPVVAVVVGFLLLLPALVYGDVGVLVEMFQDKNCTLENPASVTSLGTDRPPATFNATLNASYTFESAILTSYTGPVYYLFACQAGLLCNETGFRIPFDLNDTGACSTAGPPGTKFNKFLLA